MTYAVFHTYSPTSYRGVATTTWVLFRICLAGFWRDREGCFIAEIQGLDSVFEPTGGSDWTPFFSAILPLPVAR